MVREKSEKIEDGADEGMLAANEKEQLARKDEVKFISGDHNINGDAKIDIGAIDKVRERDVIRFVANGTMLHEFLFGVKQTFSANCFHCRRQTFTGRTWDSVLARN